MNKLFEIPSINLFLCAFCAFLWLKNPRNLRNPRLMNYLRAFGIFTLVKSPLQIAPFMQNEPNFRKSQMNVKHFNTVDYENRTLGERGKNEPNTNPTCRGVASGEAGTNPIYRGVASGEAGTNPIYRGVASGEAGSKAKKCCSPPFRCGVSVKDYTCNVPYNMVK